jgi:hypothetical protein
MSVVQHTINHGGFEPSRRNTIFKQQVNFTKGAILGLWKTKPTPNEA